MTIEVVAVVAHHPTNAGWRHVTIRRDGEQVRAICFDGSAADTLQPGSLPEAWSVKEGTHGPIVQPPRKPGMGGGGGYRNSAEGCRLEQDRLDARMAAQLAARGGSFDREMAEAVLGWLKAAR
jgi:hypothetical protein